jgi:hypothetical protein
VEDLVDRRCRGRLPAGHAGNWSARLAPGQPKTVITQAAQDLLATPHLRAQAAHQGDGVLHLLIRVFHHTPIRQALQSGRELLPLRAALDLPQPPRRHPQAEDVQFGVAQHTPQAQEQPVVVVAWIVDPIRSGDQGTRHGSQVE